MRERGFLDCHSHVLPSGDDGVDSVEEGRALCLEAARRGTAVLYATPHVWPHLPLTAEREQAVRETFAELAPRAGLELRLGFELTPAEPLLHEDLRRYALDGTEAILVEVPFHGPGDLLFGVAERAEEQGLLPVIAHPERTEAVRADRRLPYELAARGWAVQVNATSLLGRHGETAEELGWRLLEDGAASIVASDGHREARPPYLDEAFAAARARLGETALRFFDGSALTASRKERLPSRAGSPGA